MKIVIGIILGIISYHLIRKAWMAFQMQELRTIAGLSGPKEINCKPGKWGKRFKYLHNFGVETRLHLRLQLLYLKKDLLKFCLEHNVFNFKASPLGKCLQSRVDLETDIVGAAECLVFFHEPFLLEFKHYLYGITHPDPVIYGGKGVGKRERSARSMDPDDSVH